jgi:hypothetical protein
MMAVALCALAALVVLAVVGRHNEAAAARRWEGVLGPEPAEVYERVRECIEAQSLMVEMSYRGANRHQAAGTTDEALHLLRLGSRSLEASSPPLLHLMGRILSISRHAEALGPVPALRRSSFRTGEMRGLAALHGAFHALVATMRHRLAFRVAMMSSGVRVVRLLLSHSTHAALEDPDTARWGRMVALSGDFSALGREALATLRIVLASLRQGLLATAASQPSGAR